MGIVKKTSFKVNLSYPHPWLDNINYILDTFHFKMLVTNMLIKMFEFKYHSICAIFLALVKMGEINSSGYGAVTFF